MKTKKKVVVIMQARTGSSRLPGKVLKKILGKTILEFQIERLADLKQADLVVVATSELTQDDAIELECQRLGVQCFRGKEVDVLDRYYQCAKKYEGEIVVRVTSDCPFLDPDLIDKMITHFCDYEGKLDYLSNNRVHAYPHGLDAEVIRFEALEQACRDDQDLASREHVSSYITSHPEIFRLENFDNPEDPKGQLGLSSYRWTLDYPEDFEFFNQVLPKLYPHNPKFRWKDVLALIQKEPDLKNINSHLMVRK